jgi:catechol 2,3-dioxygenase-like lactoylglutathione lyase family enzyme
VVWRSAKLIVASSARGLERIALKRFHIALGVADVEASADDYSQRLGCRPDLLIPGKDALGAWTRSTCRFGKWATKRVGLTGGMA